MATTIAAPAIRTWADIVQGDSKKNVENNTETPIKPSSRGSLLRFCRGEVLTMLSHYGWLMVYGNVDHPSVDQHGGDVYIHKDDIIGDESLMPGDVVNFYLYVDDQGLGAEECTVEQKAASRFNPNAAEFVPSDMKATSQSAMFNFNVSAKNFVLGDCSSMPATSDLIVVDSVADVSDVFSRMSHVFSGLLDEEEAEEECKLVKSWQSKCASMSDDSTCGGLTSDSEAEESSLGEGSDSEMESCSQMPTLLAKKLPPGMTIPLNFRPPPGLSLPAAYEEAPDF